MPPVTADTNIYVSALQFGGMPLQFVEAARAGAFRLAWSAALRGEVRRVLVDKFLWSFEHVAEAFSDLDECSVFVHPAQTLAVVAEDPADDRILECAVAAGSHYLVSGDNHLLRLGSYDGIRILRVADFINLLPEL